MTTTLALTCQPFAFALIVWLLLRHLTERDTARDALLAAERDAARADLQTLLQRIQAPEQAVISHAIAQATQDPDGSPRTEQESAEASDEHLRWKATLDEIERTELKMQQQLGAMVR